MLMQAQGTVLPSLSFEILRVVTSTRTILVKSEKSGLNSVAVSGLELPTNLNGRLWLHFAHRDPTTYISALDVLDESVAPAALAGKLVLIGTSAASLNDIKSTPVDPQFPSVAVHATV